MTWLQTTGVDIRTLPPSEPSMVSCCYCNRVVAPTEPGNEKRCACPPHRGVAYEGKRFVYGIRSLFVRVELALAASLLLTLGGCAASNGAAGPFVLGIVLIVGFGVVALRDARVLGEPMTMYERRSMKVGITVCAVMSAVGFLLAACSH